MAFDATDLYKNDWEAFKNLPPRVDPLEMVYNEVKNLVAKLSPQFTIVQVPFPVKVNENIPKGELWVMDSYYNVVGKIVNIGE
jgi:hypothetical protein